MLHVEAKKNWTRALCSYPTHSLHGSPPDVAGLLHVEAKKIGPERSAPTQLTRCLAHHPTWPIPATGHCQLGPTSIHNLDYHQ
jgi:hypothetical protein